MDVKTVATRLPGLDHALLEFVIKNESARPVSVRNVRLAWTFTPPSPNEIRMLAIDLQQRAKQLGNF